MVGFGSFLMLVAASATLSAGPSPAEFAAALSEFSGEQVGAAEVRDLRCEAIAEEPTEAFCRFELYQHDGWHRFSTYVAVDANGWHLIDEPTPD